MHDRRTFDDCSTRQPAGVPSSSSSAASACSSPPPRRQHYRTLDLLDTRSHHLTAAAAVAISRFHHVESPIIVTVGGNTKHPSRDSGRLPPSSSRLAVTGRGVSACLFQPSPPSCNDGQSGRPTQLPAWSTTFSTPLHSAQRTTLTIPSFSGDKATHHRHRSSFLHDPPASRETSLSAHTANDQPNWDRPELRRRLAACHRASCQRGFGWSRSTT